MADQTPPPPAPEPQMPTPPPATAPPGYDQRGAAPSAAWGTPSAGYAPQAGYAPPTQWRSLRGLTNALTWLFASAMVVAVLIIVGVINHMSVLGDHDIGGLIIDAKPVNDAANFPAAMLLIFVLLSLAIFVVFIIWLFRAAKNNEALGRVNPRFGPGWAIGSWFIPLANLVIPVLIVSDIWRGSDPSVPRGDPNWRRAPAGPIVYLWWAAYLVMTIPRGFTGIGKNEQGRFTKVSDLRRSDILELVAAIGAIAAGALAITMVRQLAARQEACLQAQQATAGSQPPAA